jgi:hypothetical protein
VEGVGSRIADKWPVTTEGLHGLTQRLTSVLSLHSLGFKHVFENAAAPDHPDLPSPR